MRLAIAGGPRSGKTTLAGRVHEGGLAAETPLALIGAPVHHTDDLIDLGWSEASEKATEWFGPGESHIVEGVAVPRGLRKWLKANDRGKPVDMVIWIDGAHEELSDGQERMAKGCLTVFEEIVPELLRRGCVIVHL